MLLTIVLILAVALAAVLLIAALKPAEFRVSRGATMAAPPATVFGFINDFHEWKAWSPWEKLDPAARSIFSGPASGTGASLAWEGNKKVGAGQMTITESRPGELIRIKMEFFKPMPGVSAVEFVFRPQGGSTAVTWTMTGRSNFVGRLFCLFVNLDQMIGGNYEEGLAAIRRLAEAAARK